MPQMNFGEVEEKVVTREEFPLSRAKEVFAGDVIAMLGYGVQGAAQALNLRDNGFKVIIGQRPQSSSWDKAVADGWRPGVDLLPFEDACRQGTVLCYLLSDAGQLQSWPTLKKHLTPGKTLYFSHGFAVTYSDKTGIVPPQGVDVVLAAPKGSGRSVRRLFLQGKGINSSYAVHQDASGKAEEKALAIGIGIGSGYLFKTTFKHEVYSDLTGERGVLMGALAGIIEAQYEVLRGRGHSPSEAFNETVEELTQSLVPLVAENGMDWMFGNCSTTAQRGALDWKPRFKEATLPVFQKLYAAVADGSEAQRVIEANGRKDYKEQLKKELDALGGSELWRVGRQVRSLRPDGAQSKPAKEETAAR